MQPKPSSGTTPGSQGRFAGYDVLGQVRAWDEVTAGVVLRRLGPPQPLRFFTPAEEATARALFDQILNQQQDPKVPVLEMVDERLNADLTDGWHYQDMPEDREAWHSTLCYLDEDSHAAYSEPFWHVSWDDQGALLQAIADCGDQHWHGMSAARVWSLWTRYACTAFYAHPWAWNEIGFGGPAYPRGYKNLGLDRREPWERPERHAADPIPEITSLESRRRQGEYA